MILTITPNPVLDRILTVPGFQPGKVCRSTSLTLSAGGKGLNVARAIRILGGQSLCTGFLGGHVGRLVADISSREALPARWTWIDGETRVTAIIMVPGQTGITVINEEGPGLLQPDWDRLQTEVLSAATGAKAICLNGSLPPGIAPENVETLIRALRRDRRRVFVDSSGAPLQAAVKASPDGIKINGLEAASLLGWPECSDAATAVKAARAIQRQGISRVAITLGADGAVVATPAGQWAATPPRVQAINPIGSGDAFLAGFTQSIMEGLPDAEALRCAVAAGTANALSTGGGAFASVEYQRILAGVTVRPIAQPA